MKGFNVIYSNDWLVSIPSPQKKSTPISPSPSLKKPLVYVPDGQIPFPKKEFYIGSFTQDGSYVPAPGSFDLDDKINFSYHFELDQFNPPPQEESVLLFVDSPSENPFQDLSNHIDSLQATNTSKYITSQIKVHLHEILKFNITNSMSKNLHEFCEAVSINPEGVVSITLNITYSKASLLSATCTIRMTKNAVSF
jgi:hypothetical protein